MFVTFITSITIRHFYQIMDYRDTRAYILDPCIQEFWYKSSLTNISPFYRNAIGAMKEVPNKEISKGNSKKKYWCIHLVMAKKNYIFFWTWKLGFPDTKCIFACYVFVCTYTQYGNFKIFVSLRFHVKSILENLEILKLPILQFQGLWIEFIR